MTFPTITCRLAIRPYDYLGPLLAGDTSSSDLDLRVTPHSRIAGVIEAGDVDAAEMSLSAYVRGRLAGDERFQAIPTALYRGFRHRSFYVSQESPLGSLAELRGCTIGADRWVDSGMVWSRAALRHAGVDLAGVKWIVGPFVEPEESEIRELLPAGSELLPRENRLLDELSSGRVDAIMSSRAPKELYEPDLGSQGIRRLLVDYRSAEEEYFNDTRVYPVFHILVVRREWFDANPTGAEALADAISMSWTSWWNSTLELAYPNLPWGLPEQESTTVLFENGVPPTGDLTRDNVVAAMRSFSEELMAQGLSPKVVESSRLFDFV